MPDFPDTYEFSDNFDLPKPTRASKASEATSVGELADRLDAVLTKGIRSSGKSVVAAEQSVSSGSYAYLGTPDRVQDMVVEENSDLIAVVFRAFIAHADSTISSGDPAAGSAAIFLDATKASADKDIHISESGNVLVTQLGYPGLTTQTGLVYLMGLAILQANAGTYDVSIRFKIASGGTLSLSDRRLNVFSLGAGLPS